ncbi:MAG: DUF72 domain-containing protein [Gemmatimonadetes bacterium]|nr:DUF72 domain-containing protein [Gemmatimonadota bacterium]
MDLQLGLFGDDAPSDAAATGPVDAAPPGPHLAALAAKLSPLLRLGTSSWSFPGWEGIVYDRQASQRVLAREGLASYARHPLLRTVGLDRTYYKSITAADYLAYAKSVPKDFRFLVKADRLITSPSDPDPHGVRGTNPLFLDPAYAANEVVGPIVEGLGGKAGPILFQFSPIPPNLVSGSGPFIDRLFRFLDALPKGPLYCVELRTAAFLTEAYPEALIAAGVAHCYTVHPAMASLERQLQLMQAYQQPALVMRWMLHAGLRYEAAKERYEPFNQIVDDDSESRERIAIAVLDALIAERGVFVIANNKAEGSAPLSIFRLAERIAARDFPDSPSVTDQP